MEAQIKLIIASTMKIAWVFYRLRKWICLNGYFRCLDSDHFETTSLSERYHWQRRDIRIWKATDTANDHIFANQFCNSKNQRNRIDNCYVPPSATVVQYEEVQDSLLIDAKGHSPEMITSNFHRTRERKTKGQTLLKIFAELDIVLANMQCMSIFRGKGWSFIVDMTYLSTSFVRRMVWEW